MNTAELYIIYRKNYANKKIIEKKYILYTKQNEFKLVKNIKKIFTY
jgi:hypothetical protein